ncbi:SLAP domain-containing protein [Companilactobacillus muriivasis]|uniref:SLAP domain-containing protein n=1 Tax=Companilactobacillus muriivasis TaxID=3081444 RepID=UPI0030C6FD37
MKIKNFVASLLTVTSLALVGVSVQSQTVDAATVSTSDTSSVIYIANANGATLYTTPDSQGNMSFAGARLQNKTAWRTNKIANVNGVTYYQVANNAWVAATDSSSTAPAVALDKDMYVKANGGVNLYDAPNGSFNGYSVKGGNMVHVYQSETDANGTTWYDVGKSRWIKGDYLSNDNVKQTLTMNATAYDPAVLGSSMGYSGVAANLSKFPKGTHLRITASNGQTFDRVVNDTGYFAYSNPNQLDIAMPNSQALQFGRQNVTVQVIG